MKIKSVKAVSNSTLEYLKKLNQERMISLLEKLRTGAPMSTSLGGRYFHKNDWWDKALRKDIGAGIERDVGCIIEAEDGSWGFGFSDRGRITASIIDDYLAPNLIGRSILKLKKIYDMMTRILSPIGSNSFSSRAISAVDLALWDLKGKVLEKQYMNYWGGSIIEKLPLYASSNNTEWLKELGFKNFKRFISYGPRDGIDGLKKTEDEIAKTRDLIGYKSDLMLDCWLSMDIETTVKLSQLLQPFKLKWIEDALISESINQYEILRNRIPNETLSTEHWYGVYPFFHTASKGYYRYFATRCYLGWWFVGNNKNSPYSRSGWY